MLNFFIFRQLQRLMVIFVLFFYTMLAYAGNGEKATVSVAVTNNSTGSGTIYVDSPGNTTVEKKAEDNNDTKKTFTIYANPINNSIFEGWYKNVEGTNFAFSETSKEITLEITNKNKYPSETYYAKFFFPKVLNLRAEDKKEGQFTIRWTAPQMPDGYRISKYFIHLYKNPTKDGNWVRSYDVDPSKTELIINNLIEARPYDVHVGVEFYDNNGKLVTLSNWGTDDNWTHLTDISVTAQPFDGEKLYEGEWYRMMINNTKTLVKDYHAGGASGTYTFPLNYPCENLKYEAWLNASADLSHSISDDVTKNSINLADKDYQSGDRYTLPTTNIDKSITQIVFTGTQAASGSKTIYVDNIYAKIAPHTRLLNGTNNTTALANHNTISTAVFNTEFNTPLNTQDSRTIKFYSVLTGANGFKVSIYNPNNINLTEQGIKLYHSGFGEVNEIPVGANEFLSIENREGWNFEIRHNPTKLISNATIYIRISNPGAVNATIDIPVKLSSSLATPEGLKCDASGYTFAQLSWNAVEGAEKYNLYDGNTLVGTYTTTSATITGLAYGSNHSYTVTSVVGSTESNRSNTAVQVICPAYPQIQNIHFTNLQQNQVTVNWDPVTITPNGHSIARYHIHLYQPSTAGTFIKAFTTTETSYPLTDLIDNTEYTVYIDVEYQYTLNGNTITDTDWPWSYASFTTTSFITSDPFIGVKMYKGAWYYVNLNNDINITSNPMPIKLGYPCNYLTFKANTVGAGTLSIGNSVGVKEDNEHTYTTEKWSLSNEEHDGTTKIKTTTSAISIFMASGNATEVSQLKVKNIWLTIEPHILLKENRFVKNLVLNPEKTATSTAEIDFGEIEIGYNKQVNINFKSFLSVGNINAGITVDNDNVFSLNEGEKEHYIAGNNTLEEVYSNDHSFTITFNPTEAKEENYTGTLVIKDDKHTVTITLKGKCIKRTPEITWVNDKYISLGEYLAGAAYSTCGTVKYELVNEDNEDKSNIIGIDNDLNLLEGKGKGKAKIRAKVEASDKWNEVTDTTTFIVTDKIIQTIEWDQNFNAQEVGNEIELTAKAMTRETGEENGNEITYSTIDSTESIIKIIDGKKLQIVGSGYTYITAHQQGNNEYAPTDMTKLVFVIETAGGSENCWALEDTKEKTYGNGEILSTQGGLNWGPFEFEENLTTLGDKLSFKTTKVTGQTFNTTGDYLIITDDLGNLVYNSNLGKEETDIQLPDPEAKTLYFTLGGNLKVSISDIKVTPAKYITPDKNSIAFSETKVDNKAIEEIDFDWANQSDFVIAAIEDDEAGVFSVDTKTAIFGDPECGKYGTSTVKVIFSPKEETETNYIANLVLYVGDQPVPQKIPITGQGKKAEQSIYWLNISNLTTADKEVNLAHTTASTQQPITYTVVPGDNNVVKLNEDGSITVIGEGKFTLEAQQEGNNSYKPTNTITKEFTATIGNLIFDNKEKDNEWTTTRNWKPESRLNLRRNIAPSEDVEINLLVSAPLIIKNNTEVETNKQLSIEAEKGTVTVQPQGRLKVNTIDGTNGDNLTLQSSADGNGSFVFASGTPSATVEMYSKVQYGTTATDGHHPEWQYVGVAVNGATVGDFEYNNERSAWLLKWDEAENVTGDPWTDAPLADNTTLVPWAGYSISQPTAKTYSLKGTLCKGNQSNGDHIYKLTRTTRNESTQDPDCGFNLLANSYTAPIDIAKLEPSNFVGADACIILFNTGTYADWESQQTTLGQNPGQLTAIPVVTGEAAGLTTTIASMQAFFVKANENNATFTVDYETAVAGATNHGNQMRAPRAEKEFNVLKITIEGENTRDNLYLLENEETSKAYDNGYEAYKIFDAPRGHQMYATCEYGYASIDCSESFVGQTIGLKGDNEGEKLTISFDTDRLENYNSLFLYDKLTGEYINITAGETYTFFGIKGANDNRFSIVTNPIDKNQTPPFVVIGDELAFDRAQIDTENANIYIYDTSGRLLKVDKINPYENYNIPDMPVGIYLVSINGYTTKIVKK